MEKTKLCPICRENEGTFRAPNPIDVKLSGGRRKGYYSCQPCFEQVWAGEN